MMKVFLIIATMGVGSIDQVDRIEMSTIKQCGEVRSALYSRDRILMCVEIAVPLPEHRPPMG
jgi:hypothetical protein